MRSIHLSGVLFAFAVVAVGCASPAVDEGTGSPRDWAGADGKKAGAGPSSGAGDCVAETCETLGKTSGTYPDACGGTLVCGAAAACTPKTCKDLGKTSGTTDDGCGKTIDCSAAATCTDAKESNNSKDTAADLGAMTDNPNSSRIVADLTLGDGDEDWFKFKVTDGGFGGNPQIDAAVTSKTAEVSVFYVCDSQPDYSTCVIATDTADTTIGKGCRAKGKVALATECSGISESGTAYVRVKKSAADSQCTTYTLSVNVN